MSFLSLLIKLLKSLLFTVLKGLSGLPLAFIGIWNALVTPSDDAILLLAFLLALFFLFSFGSHVINDMFSDYANNTVNKSVNTLVEPKGRLSRHRGLFLFASRLFKGNTFLVSDFFNKLNIKPSISKFKPRLSKLGGFYKLIFSPSNAVKYKTKYAFRDPRLTFWISELDYYYMTYKYGDLPPIYPMIPKRELRYPPI